MLSCYWNIATTRSSRAQGEFAWRIARVWIWRAGNASHVSRGKRARGVQCAASAANHSSPSARVFESVRVIDRARETIVVREKPRRREQVARERERERDKLLRPRVDERERGKVSSVFERAVHQVRVCECVCRGCKSDDTSTDEAGIGSIPSQRGRKKEKELEGTALAAPTLHSGCTERARVQACYPNRRTRSNPAGSESFAGWFACACISSSGAL